jgi:hypothetical protein
VVTIPLIFLNIGSHLGYYLTWIVFGHIAGVHSSIDAAVAADY